jgi:Ca-activated chloride channel family protein
VPSNEFSKLVDEVSDDGHAVSEHINGQDVTGETINLRARIANLTAEESSLRSLMSRAGSIASILDVQDQLFTVEGEIEQLTAQASTLVNQATFATLDVSLHGAAAAAHHAARSGAIARAISLAGRNTVAMVRGVVLAVGWAFPAAVVAFLAGGVLWVRRRRRLGGSGTATGGSPEPATP